MSRNTVRENGLTDIEMKTIEYVKKGMSDGEIAKIEGVTISAIGARLERIFAKFGIHKRTDMILRNDLKVRCLCDHHRGYACPIHYRRNQYDKRWTEKNS